MATNFEQLITRYLNDSLTAEEAGELYEAIQQGSGIDEYLPVEMFRQAMMNSDKELDKEAFYEKLISRIKSEVVEDTITTPVHLVHFLKTAWFRYAAAIILIFGAGTYLYITNQKEKPSVTKSDSSPMKNDVAPGGNRATLTLADGSKIILDSAANGKIAEQGKTRIEKKGEQIVYTSPVSLLPSPVSFNTMTTPRGGQYKLTLPDGSQVWLNAESSITYPTAFTGNERKVSVTGEAYFEVIKNKAKPFIVSVQSGEGIGEKGEDKSLQIEVLGTHFNVNAYKDEASINTTLLEGSVRLKNTSPVFPLPSPQNSVHTSLTLKPGQQGQLSGKELSLAANPDVEQVMAWKEGKFYFNQEDLKSILRQFARWYDVDVIYEGQLKNRKFFGIVSKNSSLAAVLKLLKDSDIKFRIEGKKLIVQSD